AKCGPIPLTIPEPRYFSMPSRVLGGTTRRACVLNCKPCVRSFTQTPCPSMYSPGVMVAAVPTTVTRSRWPRTLTRRTQKPVSSLWKVTRSTAPVSCSVGWVKGEGDVGAKAAIESSEPLAGGGPRHPRGPCDRGIRYAVFLGGRAQGELTTHMSSEQ